MMEAPSIVSALVAALVPHAGAPAPDDDYWYTPYPGGNMSHAGVSVSPENVLECAAVASSVFLLAETVGSLPLMMYQRRPDGGKERAVNHPLYDILHSQASEDVTAMEWRETMMLNCVLRGEAYSEILPGPRGFADQLVAIDPTRLTIHSLPTGRRTYEVRGESAQSRVLTREQVFRLRGPSFNGKDPISRIQAARQAIGLSMAAQTYGAKFFSQGATYGVHLKFPGRLSPEARERMRQEWNENHRGLLGAHSVAILQEGLEIGESGRTNEESQFLETKKQLVSEVARYFRVQPHLIMDLDRATFANIEHQSIEFVVYTIRPWLVLWEQAIKQQLILAPQLYFAEHLVDGLLRGDTKTRYEGYSLLINAGVMTRNEARLLENWNPLPGLDDPVFQANLSSPAKTASRARALAMAAAERVVRRELQAIRTGAQRHASDAVGWESWIDAFYGRHLACVMESLALEEEDATAYVRAHKAGLLDRGISILGDWQHQSPRELVALSMGDMDDADANPA